MRRRLITLPARPRRSKADSVAGGPRGTLSPMVRDGTEGFATGAPYDVGPRVGYRPLTQAASVAGNRSWWDADAARYQAQHGDFLGGSDLVWGPEGLREAQVGLLGNLTGLDVLEVGCGGGQGARWAATAGARVVGVDFSAGMLAQARRLDKDLTSPGAAPGADGAHQPNSPALPAYVQADACRLPLADACFDVAFSAYGAVPFVADSALLMAEVARVLRPGGRWVFSVTHPLRWVFPDAPGRDGLTVTRSYFDRTPYVESTGDRVTYAEHHRTVGDRIRELTGAGFTLVDLVEPEWPPGHERTWGGWSPLRGRLIPGTAIFVTTRHGSARAGD